MRGSGFVDLIRGGRALNQQAASEGEGGPSQGGDEQAEFDEALKEPTEDPGKDGEEEPVFPLSPGHHLTPALSPTSWRRGRRVLRVVFDD